jgi:hypothetical protein
MVGTLMKLLLASICLLVFFNPSSEAFEGQRRGSESSIYDSNLSELEILREEREILIEKITEAQEQMNEEHGRGIHVIDNFKKFLEELGEDPGVDGEQWEKYKELYNNGELTSELMDAAEKEDGAFRPFLLGYLNIAVAVMVRAEILKVSPTSLAFFNFKRGPKTAIWLVSGAVIGVLILRRNHQNSRRYKALESTVEAIEKTMDALRKLDIALRNQREDLKKLQASLDFVDSEIALLESDDSNDAQLVAR